MSFCEPTVDERDITLWFMQDELTDEQCTRQLEAMQAAGIGTVICRTFTGLETPYLSDEYLRVMRGVIATAARLGMKIWLQAAWMTRDLADLPKEYESRGIKLAEGGYELVARDGAIDMLNTEAMAWYAERAYAYWFAQFGDAMGSTVTAIWTDEPMLYANLPPYTPALFERYRRDWGEELEPLLQQLYGDAADEHVALRQRYWRTVRDLIEEAYGSLGRWCREHGVLFTGHLMGEETFGESINFAAGCMPLYRHFGIPGIDHLTADLTWMPGNYERCDTPFLLTPLQCSSVAEQYDDTGSALAEVYGVAPNAIDFAMMNRIGDYFQVLGIDRRVIHSCPYSLRGLRKRLWPPQIGPQQPWWPEFGRVNDRLARIGTQLRRGQHEADILIIHPLESAYGRHDAARHGKGARSACTETETRFEQDLIAVCESLLDTRRQFHLGDEGHLADDAMIDGARLRLAKASYGSVVIPSCESLRRTTVELLQAFQQAGGQVLRCGLAPERCDGIRDDEVAAWITAIPACGIDALAARFPDPLDISADGPLRARIRRDGEERIVFLHNPSDRDSINATIPDGWTLLDCEAGKQRPPHRHHRFEPGASLLLCSDATVRSIDPDHGPATEIARFEGPWRLERQEANVMVLDTCTLVRGDGKCWEDFPIYASMQLLRDDDLYEGPIELHFDLRCDDNVHVEALVIEEAMQWQVELDDETIPNTPQGCWRDHRFECLPLRRQLAAGWHRITLRRDYTAPPTVWASGLAKQMKPRPGIECEPITLLGDFIVRGTFGSKHDPQRCRRLARPLTLTSDPQRGKGLVVDDGHPFYVGQLDHCCTIELPDRIDGRILLDIPQAEATTLRININGQPLPSLAWAPWRIDITQQVRPGVNEIRIGLVTGLRNAVGPFHRPIGESLQNWGPISWDGAKCPETGETFERWYEIKEDTSAFTHDWLPIAYGLPQGMRIMRTSEE